MLSVREKEGIKETHSRRAETKSREGNKGLEKKNAVLEAAHLPGKLGKMSHRGQVVKV